ncbi:hypothetical protein, partial [Clostridium perfringens]|uniref:hypothetical protein n=1 Tax=Clostridium perfringens TaxID=1502 RepID=UPI0032DB0E74
YVAQAKQEIKKFKNLQSEMLKTNETINNNEKSRVKAETERVQAEAKRGKALEVAKIEIDKINNCFDLVNYLSLEDLKVINAYVDFDGGIKASSDVIS